MTGMKWRQLPSLDRFERDHAALGADRFSRSCFGFKHINMMASLLLLVATIEWTVNNLGNSLFLTDPKWRPRESLFPLVTSAFKFKNLNSTSFCFLRKVN